MERARLLAAIVGISLLLGGCQSTARLREGASVTIEVPPQEDSWTQVASPADTERILTLTAVWTQALDAARAAGFNRQIDAEGPLLQPDAALSFPQPTPGFYTCRVLRFGGKRAFTAFKPFFCYVGVNEDRLALTKDTGSERPGGYLWDDMQKKRLIFLGAMALGSEKAPPAYGDNSERDLAGVLERIGEFRFRLVLPRQEGAAMDVLELVAAP
jgi:hypothetical protein